MSERSSLASAARRRTLDLPAKPEAGLAEWTSKIKALQRQVDDDEEAEHKRLEEEIAASRLARLRRSTGYGQGSTLDLSNSEYAHALKDESIPKSAEPAKSTFDAREQQDVALRTLTCETKERPASSSFGLTQSAAPMSLAAFMGGRATGPRLTKPAPQPDAHDPTQFDQRTYNKEPHPVFGRGGVAMPGMVGRASISSNPTGTRDERDTLATVSNQLGERDRRISTPSVVKTFVKKAEEQPLASQKTGSWQTTRQRTTSTPSGISPIRDVPTGNYLDAIGRPKAESPRPTYSPGLRSTTPQALHKPSSPLPPPSSPGPRPSTSFQAHPLYSGSPASRSTPSFQTSSSIPSVSTPPKAAITTPSLARTVQPSPRQSLNIPQIIAPHPSPAFLRAPPSKEPTPSISRLQGRGFVQSMVKASSQLEMGVSSSPPASDKTDSPGKKSTPVLDRWQVNAGNPGASPSPPIISPKPVPLRKTRTVESGPASPTHTPTPPVKPEHTGRPKSRASLPSDARSSSSASDAGRDTASRRTGLGSSSTMISYIKPIKTGDRPQTASPPPPSRSHAGSPEVDELGMRVRPTRTGGSAWEAPATAGKPLSHLTKDRAKRPRKTKGTDGVKQVNASASSASLSPGHGGGTAPATQLASTITLKSRIAELVASTPVSTHSAKPPSSPRIASPLKEQFEDNFNPVVKPAVPRKPPPFADAPANAPPVLPKVLPNLGIATSTAVANAEKSPITPSRHVRIPSTGNRATVMDVAQVFQERVNLDRIQPTSPHAVSEKWLTESGLEDETEDETAPLPDVKSMVASWGPRDGVTQPAQTEKRKSSFEKYSTIAMPPLKEERTPVPSPAGTLSRSAVRAPQEPASPKTVDLEGPKELLVLPASQVERPIEETESKFVHIECADEPLPKVNLDALLTAHGTKSTPDSDVQTISIDVMSVVGDTATPVKGEINVLYDSDLLAVVHRAKARSSGLVSTRVWGWQGKRHTTGEREERKLQELARRYGSALTTIDQHCEPVDFVAVLGDRLITRQGARAHWSSENTAMHLVRSMGNAIFIDELELHIRNLCSGFSYCLSLLDTLYVWYGCGSTAEERTAALQYARSLASNPAGVIELSEGIDDNDEMFWMILGDGEYAKADYWKWRPSADVVPRIWCVDVAATGKEIFALQALANHPAIHDFVYIADCVWEFFVLVPSEARGKRQDIRLALSTATALAAKIAPSRPFTPTVHAVILPSQIPTDLRLNFRDLDEVQLNCGIIPEHMNLVPVSEAEEHLRVTVWEKSALQDPTMLPLGVHTSNMK